MSEFAWQNLFTPIGINEEDLEWDDIEWEWPQGSVDRITFGGFGIYTTPRVMGRIGLLCLNNGNWDGTQLVSEEWITEATENHVGVPDYGYLFWLNSSANVYSAQGFLGQSIYVIPEYDLVVVFTAEDQSQTITDKYKHILNNFIVKAATTPITPIPGYNLLIFLGIISAVVIFKIKKQSKNNKF
jgi:CubicO group peptidase (beta-lactamase class C family)